MSLLPYLRDHWSDSFSTFTNLAYPVFGFFLLPYSLFLFLFFTLVGVASTGFHWLRSKAWHKFDLVAIIYCFGVIAGHLVYGIPGGFIGVIPAAIAHYFYHKFNPRHAIVLFGLIALIAHGLQNPIEQTAQIIAVFAVAFILSTVAEKFYSRNHKKYDLLHGVWHLVSAYGMYLLCLPPQHLGS